MTASQQRREPDSPVAGDNGKAFYLMCAYGLRVRNARPPGGFARHLFRLLTLPSLRAFIAMYRDFYANPRDLEYMMARAGELAAGRKDGHVDVIVDTGWGEAAIKTKNRTVDAHVVAAFDDADAWQHAPLDGAGLRAYDEVVLFYPDALGLGHSRTETRLAAHRVAVVKVYNGRRRCFLLDRDMRRSLAWRRLLARTRVCELAFTLVVVPLAAALSVVDMVKAVQRR